MEYDKLTWLKKKPKQKDLKECIIITRYFNGGYYEYNVYQINKIQNEDSWYWGLCNLSGEEWDSYQDFKPKELAVIEI